MPGGEQPIRACKKHYPLVWFLPKTNILNIYQISSYGKCYLLLLEHCIVLVLLSINDNHHLKINWKLTCERNLICLCVGGLVMVGCLWKQKVIFCNESGRERTALQKNPEQV